MWCDTQRTAKKGKGGKKGSKISPARISKLDGIGFDWGTTMAGTPEQRWNENFEKVRQFRVEHGRWPKKREGAVGAWCNTQRSARKGQGTHRISPAQIAKLDGVGFVWGSTMTPEQRWNENFEEVRRFRVEHGRWPKTVSYTHLTLPTILLV